MAQPEEAQQFPCPNCGADLHWDPKAASMRCPFCDSTVPVPDMPGFEPEEHDLESFLTDHPEAEGYGVRRQEFQCRQCGAGVQVEAERRDLTCPFCGTHYVFEATRVPTRVLKPDGVLPFKIDGKTCRRRFKAWLGRGWFTPGKLKRLARLDRILGFYLPFFTFDARAESRWRAEAGYYETTEETIRTTDAGGNPEFRTRRVRRIRWTPAEGSRTDVYDDLPVAALHDERLRLVDRILPYDFTESRPYNPAYLAGFGVMNPDMTLAEVHRKARAIMRKRQVERCAGDVPGDTYRNLQVSIRWSEQRFKHLLCPVWMGAYRYRGRLFHFLLNGQTGKIHGEKPISWLKVALVAAAVLFLLWLYFHVHG